MSKDKKQFFPIPIQANEDGIVAVGGELKTEILIEAYGRGIFPWPHEGFPLLWFCPWERGVLFFEDLHISRSLNKTMKKVNWTYSWNKAFAEVITECSSAPRAGQRGTWITADMIHSYVMLHKKGFAHSLEVWENDELIGGIYGVFINNVFSAESMFHKKSGASKVALVQLVHKLQKAGLAWLDIQMLTPLTEKFGGKYISQKDFLILLRNSQKKPLISM